MKKFIRSSLLFFLLLITFFLIFESITGQIIVSNTNFELDSKPEYIVLGHSHPEQAFNDSLINNFSNISESGESYFYTYHKSKKIIESNMQVKTVFIEFTNNSIDTKMDDWTWNCDNLSYRFLNFSHLINFKDKLKLAYHNPYCFVLTFNSLLIKRCKQLFKKKIIYSNKLGGFKVANANNKFEIIGRDVRNGAKKSKLLDYSEINIEYLQKLVLQCAIYNKQVIFLRTPQRKDYEFWDNEVQFQSIRNKFFPEIPFFDLSKLELNENDYLDAAHLNLKGANKLSLWFNEVLKSDILKTKSYSKLDDFIANFNIK